MRRTILTLTALSLVAILPVAAQQAAERTPSGPPAKGDEVVVVGCITGPAVEAQETRHVGQETGIDRAITYRMSGKKDLVKRLREDHDGHLEELTGVLRSALPDASQQRGAQIGRTRIFVGGSSGRRSPMDNAMPAQHLPVLEVKASRHINGRCN